MPNLFAQVKLNKVTHLPLPLTLQCNLFAASSPCPYNFFATSSPLTRQLVCLFLLLSSLTQLPVSLTLTQQVSIPLTQQCNSFALYPNSTRQILCHALCLFHSTMQLSGQLLLLNNVTHLPLTLKELYLTHLLVYPYSTDAYLTCLPNCHNQEYNELVQKM